MVVGLTEEQAAEVRDKTTATRPHCRSRMRRTPLVEAVAGVTPAERGLPYLDPALPTEVKQLRFSVHYRG